MSSLITATFVVKLSKKSNSNITFNYQTQDGTALAGSDYIATSGSVTFIPGMTVQYINVKVYTKPIGTSQTQFSVKLTDPSTGVTIATLQPNCYLITQPRQISISDISVDATGTSSSITISNTTIDATEGTVIPDPDPTFSVLSTSGRNIVTPSSSVVRLKSVNWFGAESSNYIPHGIWQVSYKSLIDDIAGWGFNCIRIPFSGDTFTDGMVVNGINTSVEDNHVFILSGDPTVPSGVVFKSAFDCMDIIVNYAATKGLYVIFDHHRRSAGAGADGSPIDSTYTLAKFIATWQLVTTHYSSFTNVIGADIHNEPHDLDWATWAGYVEQAGNAIHAINPDWLIFVEGVGTYNSESYWWGGMLKGVATRPISLTHSNKVVYSPHEYGQSVGAQSWLSTDSTPVTGYPGNLPAVFRNAWGFIAEQNIAPIWIGEFGGHFGTDSAGASTPNQTVEEQWLAQLETYINTYSLNFAYWCLNPNSADTGGLLFNDWTSVQTHKISLLQPILS